MRDRLTHPYFATSSAILQETVDADLPELRDAVGRLRAQTRDD
jgi:uncharacterized protein with HEPN domain